MELTHLEAKAPLSEFFFEELGTLHIGQGLDWCDSAANRRIHVTTLRVPWEMLAQERPRLGKLPGRNTQAPWPGRTRRWLGNASSTGRAPATESTQSGLAASYRWASARDGLGGWAGVELFAVHPWARKLGQWFILPGE